MAIFNAITRDELESVFQEELRRLDACVQGLGDYME
jgi:hypothetical protein